MPRTQPDLTTLKTKKKKKKIPSQSYLIAGATSDTGDGCTVLIPVVREILRPLLALETLARDLFTRFNTDSPTPFLGMKVSYPHALWCDIVDFIDGDGEPEMEEFTQWTRGELDIGASKHWIPDVKNAQIDETGVYFQMQLKSSTRSSCYESNCQLTWSQLHAAYDQLKRD